jgi:hypothetical protein
MHQNNSTNIIQQGSTVMKNPVLVVVLLLAGFVSACDTEGVVEPLQGDVAASTGLVSEKPAPPQQTILINEVIEDPDGIAQDYLASGLISYSMVGGPLSSALCNSYTIYSTVEGGVSPLPNDDVAVWKFHGAHTVSVCVGNSENVLTITCPLSGRSDGASLRLDLMVTPTRMELQGASIEVPGGEIAPATD